MNLPETRPSLLVRIRNPADDDAWYQFSEIYRPVIIRLVARGGLQDADAEDIAQQVLVSVAGAINRFDPKGSAKFRTWLKRITENAILNAITRSRPDQALGGVETHSLLNEIVEHSGPDTDCLRLEYRREVFQWAAKQVRTEFSEATWGAFWLTAVQDVSIDDAAEALGRSRGSIYASRRRVMRRIVDVVSEFEGEVV